MKRLFHLLLVVFILINLVFIQSCKKDENPIIPPDETVKIPSTTKYITPADFNSYFVGFSNDSTQLIFKNEANTKYDYKVNDVIVISEGEGLLKKITSIQNSNNQFILSTEDASLTEAIEKGVVNFAQTLSPSVLGKCSKEFGIEVINNKLQKTGETTSFTITINQILYDNDNNLNTTYDQVKLTGSLELGPTISGTIELENFDVKKIDISYDMVEHLTLHATVGILPSIPIATKKFPKIPLGQIVVIVGGVPVIINPELNITAGVEIYNNSKVQFGLDQSLSYTSGMKYENGNWTTYKQIDSSFSYQVPEFEIDFGAKAYIKPQLDLKIYKTLAPYLFADLYSKFAVTPLQTPVWKLFAGLDIGGGVKMKIFKKTLFDFSTTFFSGEFILAQGGIPGSTPQPPILSSPSNGATNTSASPTLSWNASTGATSYTLQVSTSSGFTSYVYNSDVGNVTSKLISGLNNSSTYYWRVKASNTYGTSNPSTTWSFTTSSGGATPQPPTLSSPSNGSTNISTSPTLTWNASSGATSYTLQVSTNSGFTSYVYNSDVGNVMSKQISGLNNLSTYYWRVKASNTYGTSVPSTAWNFTTVQSGGGGIPTEGLVAYYPFNGNANDESVNGNNGTTHGGCSWVTGKFSDACSFDGTGYISVPNSTSLKSPSTTLSITFWLYIDLWNSNWAPILAKSNTPNSYGQYSVEISKDYGANFWTGTNVNVFSHQLAIGSWYHIAFTWDGTQAKFYLNGILKETINYSGTITQDNLPLEIGRHIPGGTNDYLKGKLDVLLFYNRALTESEIQGLQN